MPTGTIGHTGSVLDANGVRLPVPIWGSLQLPVKPNSNVHLEWFVVKQIKNNAYVHPDGKDASVWRACPPSAAPPCPACGLSLPLSCSALRRPPSLPLGEASAPVAGAEYNAAGSVACRYGPFWTTINMKKKAQSARLLQ